MAPPSNGTYRIRDVGTNGWLTLTDANEIEVKELSDPSAAQQVFSSTISHGLSKFQILPEVAYNEL